jgi:ecotin
MKPDLKPYPAAGAGYERFVFRLPAIPQEEDRKVELVVGKMVLVDEVNRYFFGGSLTRESVKGWGYSIYRVESPGVLAGTRAAVPEGAPKVERFIRVNMENNMIRYNSKLPVVVYVPGGFAARFRIWVAGEEQPAAVE